MIIIIIYSRSGMMMIYCRRANIKTTRSEQANEHVMLFQLITLLSYYVFMLVVFNVLSPMNE